MGPGSVEVLHIGIQDSLELLFLKNQQMVQAFLPDTPQEALADRISSWRVMRRCEKLDTTCRGNSSKARPKFVIVIMYQILWRLSIGGGFSQLLCHPGIGRRACHADLDHLPWLQLDNEERESGRKKRSVTCRKSHAQICPAWLRRKVAHF